MVDTQVPAGILRSCRRPGHARAILPRGRAGCSLPLRSLSAVAGLTLVLGACGQSTPPRPADVATHGPASLASAVPDRTPSATPAGIAPSSPPTPVASPTPGGQSTAPTGGAPNVYAGAGAGMFSPAVAAFPPRVYVPDEAAGTVVVIDPATYRILLRYKVGASPEHVTPDWDLQRLYVEASYSSRLTVIDPRTGRAVGHHAVPGPYNLYFTLDGRMAIVVLDSRVSGVEYGGQKQLALLRPPHVAS